MTSGPREHNTGKYGWAPVGTAGKVQQGAASASRPPLLFGEHCVAVTRRSLGSPRTRGRLTILCLSSVSPALLLFEGG